MRNNTPKKYGKRKLIVDIGIIECYNFKCLGELAQLARAPALHAGGQGFESLILHH